MDVTEKINLVKDEYFHLQKVIEDFDARTLTIKAWSVTFSLVVLGGAFASHAAPVLLVGSFSACLFWILEGYWKSFQLAYYARAEEIESYFARGVDDIVPMQITKSWYVAFRGEDKRHLLRLKSGDMRRWLEAENKDKIRLLRSKSEDRVRFPILLWPGLVATCFCVPRWLVTFHAVRSGCHSRISRRSIGCAWWFTRTSRRSSAAMTTIAQ
jgi:hypothetical protein